VHQAFIRDVNTVQINTHRALGKDHPYAYVLGRILAGSPIGENKPLIHANAHQLSNKSLILQ